MDRHLTADEFKAVIKTEKGIDLLPHDKDARASLTQRLFSNHDITDDITTRSIWKMCGNGSVNATEREVFTDFAHMQCRLRNFKNVTEAYNHMLVGNSIPEAKGVFVELGGFILRPQLATDGCNGCHLEIDDFDDNAFNLDNICHLTECHKTGSIYKIVGVSDE